jgi:SOS response regulatory protein OraA/RecX
VVEDTITEEVYDEYLGKMQSREVMKGKHVAKEKPSERLVKKLMENGIRKKDIDELLNKYQEYKG